MAAKMAGVEPGEARPIGVPLAILPDWLVFLAWSPCLEFLSFPTRQF